MTKTLAEALDFLKDVRLGSSVTLSPDQVSEIVLLLPLEGHPVEVVKVDWAAIEQAKKADAAAFANTWGEIKGNAAEPGVVQSPLAQAVLDRVDGTNLGLFITSAVDHIESGGNYASSETTLGSGVKVEVRLSRVTQQGERLWGLESRLPGGEWTTYYAIYPRLSTAESAARHGGPPGSEWRVVEYQKVASNALKSVPRCIRRKTWTRPTSARENGSRS